MSETKKSIYVNGVRFFPKGDKAPQNLLANGVITPNELIKCLKQAEVQDAKTEYKGESQFKINLWQNDDNSVSMSFNTWKPEGSKQADEGDGDLPF